MSSGPAIITADGRKKKKKKNTRVRQSSPNCDRTYPTGGSGGYPQSNVCPAAHWERGPHHPPPLLDLYVPMAPPTAPSEAPLTITLPARAQAVLKGLAALPTNNSLGLNTGSAGLQPALDKPMMSARLEEAGNANSLSGKHRIRNAVERYTTGTMPPIQDCSPTSVFDYIDIDQIGEWEKHPRGKLVAIPFNNDVNISKAHNSSATRSSWQLLKS
ncbi:hypothetical protein EI94DRAFT_1701162 [Lactarius quietus]|nr:hypothetical protein EI94DRAFT_1701162 [Lactarius quietus]